MQTIAAKTDWAYPYRRFRDLSWAERAGHRTVSCTAGADSGRKCDRVPWIASWAFFLQCCIAFRAVYCQVYIRCHISVPVELEGISPSNGGVGVGQPGAAFLPR